MKLHQSTIDKLIKTFELYGGRKDQAKLVEHLKSMDLLVYERKNNENKGEKVLVLKEEMMKELNPNLR
jgi:hypothetical protein